MKDTKVELKETELEAVSGGDVTSANIVGTVNQLRRPTAEVTPVGMPELNDDEKYVLRSGLTDINSSCLKDNLR